MSCLQQSYAKLTELLYFYSKLRRIRMNIVLWILQVLTALAFIAAGSNKVFNPKAGAQKGMEWMGAIPRGLLTFIGSSEILGGIGLVFPALTGILPWLTPVAAALLAVVMVLAGLFHVPRREYQNIGANVVLFLLAAFIAYGRFVLVPL
jgi:putative oxidoreductase